MAPIRTADFSPALTVRSMGPPPPAVPKAAAWFSGSSRSRPSTTRGRRERRPRRLSSWTTRAPFVLLGARRQQFLELRVEARVGQRADQHRALDCSVGGTPDDERWRAVDP